MSPSLLPADFALQPCKGGGRHSIPKNEHSLLQKNNFVPVPQVLQKVPEEVAFLTDNRQLLVSPSCFVKNPL